MAKELNRDGKASIKIGIHEESQALAEAIKASSPGAVVRAPTPENRFYEVVSRKRLRIRRSDFDALPVKPLSWGGLVANRTGYLTGYNDKEIVIEAKRPSGLTDTDAAELLFMHTATPIGGVLAARAQAARAAEAPPAQPTGPVRRFPAVALAGGITQPCWYQIENPATGRIEWRHSNGTISRQTAQAIAIQEARQARAERHGRRVEDARFERQIQRQQREADRVAGAMAREKGSAAQDGGGYSITVEDSPKPVQRRVYYYEKSRRKR